MKERVKSTIAARLDPCELRTDVPYTCTLSERSAELHGKGYLVLDAYKTPRPPSPHTVFCEVLLPEHVDETARAGVSGGVRLRHAARRCSTAMQRYPSPPAATIAYEDNILKILQIFYTKTVLVILSRKRLVKNLTTYDREGGRSHAVVDLAAVRKSIGEIPHSHRIQQSRFPLLCIVQHIFIPASLDIKEKQMYVLKVLNNILQPSVYSDIGQLSTSYRIEGNLNNYTHPEYVKRLVKRMKVGVLPRGEIFTINIDRQMEEVVDMFNVLYYAKDFRTFIITAYWMSLIFNERMFSYVFTVALRHREDTKDLVLPAPYEVYPYLFVRADVIQKAEMLKMRKGMLDPKLSESYGIKKTEKGEYVIDENPYDPRVVINDEDRLRYFTEDVDINAYYYNLHVDYPFWMDDDVYHELQKNSRGELLWYTNQQILARYYLERLSNDLPNTPLLSFDDTVKKGYWPWLTYHNGIEIPARFDNYVISREYNEYIIRLVEDFETIIKDGLVKGYVPKVGGEKMDLTTQEGFNELAKALYSGYTFNKHYKDMYSYLTILLNSVIGLNTYTSNKYFVVPSALDNYETALRDPVFYQLQKRLISTFWLLKRLLPSYTKEELYFPGVRITNVAVGKLITYFDDDLVDITNAVLLDDQELQSGEASMTILARKRRLNHDPFKITIEIASDKSVDSVVRIFMGPKEDRYGRVIDINEDRHNFVEIDSFIYKLKTGKNVIERNCYEMRNVIGERITTRDLMAELKTGVDIQQLIYSKLRDSNTGYPHRLLLPKGRAGGLKVMLYAIVSPLKQVEGVDLSHYDPKLNNVPVEPRSSMLLDKRPLGFPFDRHIEVTSFLTPNMKFVDTTIFHKPQVSDMRMSLDKYVLSHYDDRMGTAYGGDRMATVYGKASSDADTNEL
ncbi:Basic juvenile hormone-suppressible protein 2 [Eumeta japonica]|uniref:Basic juvenile hormone-suppressible protein 2 n=1 Tax=Eumeta variegata TaxID=151549 RepID=A0A4C1V011_EUMVA|nr:Basic juvenile hormone-suppressible protein 2 [Eumeta japonica]